MFVKVMKELNIRVISEPVEKFDDDVHFKRHAKKKNPPRKELNNSVDLRIRKPSAVGTLPIVNTEDEKICRICRLSKTKTKEELISPCACKGTLAYIHRTCLEKWLKRSGTTYCELCRFNYTVRVLERYSKIDSVRKWFIDEENSDDARELMVDMVLALILLPIVFICTYAFATVCFDNPYQGSCSAYHNFEVHGLWMILTLGVFYIMIILSYSYWVVSRLTHYYKRWSEWMRRHGQLMLVLKKC